MTNSIRLSLALPAACVVWAALAPTSLARDPQSGAAPGTPVLPATQNDPAAAQPKAKYLRYMRVAAAGGVARNLADANANNVGSLPAGTLVAVYGESGDFLECEVPGGFEIWVYGQFVKSSSEAGMLEITGSEVRPRPLPSSGTESYPLSPNMSRGDRVRLIARHDATKQLAEDWVKVYSPPGVRGFIAKGECEALASGVDGAAAWATAVTEARKKKASTTLIPTSLPGSASVADAAASTVGDQPLTPQQALDELKRADNALAAARRSKTPDFSEARAMYERVLAATKEGATADLARRGLNEVAALTEVHNLQAALEAERSRIEQENIRRQKLLDDARNNLDQFQGRFDARGWLETRRTPGREPVYLLHWGDTTCEVQCNSRRYDLSAFDSYDIGINGREVRAYVPGDIGRVEIPRLIDAARIEVIAGRERAR